MSCSRDGGDGGDGGHGEGGEVERLCKRVDSTADG